MPDLQIKQLVDDILIINEITKIEWDGKLLRCFMDVNKVINCSPVIHKIAEKMELLRILCNIQQIAPFSIIDCKDK